MELPHIGKHCAEPTCRQLDFLPFSCNLCKKEFCVDHHKYEAHNCSESYRADVQVPICPLCNQPVPNKSGQTPDLAVNDHMENNCKNKKKKIYTNRCSAVGCKTKEMIPVSCDTCKLNFCLRHRHAVDHDCKGPVTVREQARAAAIARSNNNRKPGSGSTSRGSGGGSVGSGGTNQGIRRYFSPSLGGPRPTGTVQSARSANLSTFQSGMSEDEAMARAMAASVQDTNIQQQQRHQERGGSNKGSPSQEEEDAQLARAIAASMEDSRRPSNGQQHRNSTSNSCNVC